MKSMSKWSLVSALALLAVACSDDKKESAADTGGSGDTSDSGGSGSGDTSGSDSGSGDTDGSGALEGVSIPGLSGELTASFDALGVLHLLCATDEDCAAGLGYFHARDRFEQMDLRRRVTTGRVSQLVGAAAIEVDKRNRVTFMTRDGRYLEDAILENASPKSVAILEAYANGVNAWLADMRAGRNGAVLSEEYSFALVREENIPDWEPKDTVSSVIALADSLTNSGRDDLAISDYIAGLGEELAYEVVGPWSLDPTVIAPDYAPAGRGSLVLPRTGKAPDYGPWRSVMASALGEPGYVPATLQTSIKGSNNWVVSGTRTASGNALLANDPHLTLSNPAIWYIATVDSKSRGTGSWHAGGMSFAGLPLFLIGQNERVAWGATTTYYDMADAYLETISADGDGVVFNGETVPFITVNHTFEVANAVTGVLEPQVVPLKIVPHHGPVLSLDAAAGKAVSLRWTGNDMTTDINFLTDLNFSNNIAEAKVAISQATSVGQNWVVIDAENNIGWFPLSRVPLRPWASRSLSPWAALPGDGSAEWQGFYAYDDLPQALNPVAGYVVTANNDMTGALADGDATNDGYSPLQSSSDFGFRASRIKALVEAGGNTHTKTTMNTIAADTRLLAADMLLPALFEAAAAATLDATQSDLVARLTAWDRTCPTGLASSDAAGAASDDAAAREAAVACMIFHQYLQTATELTFDDEANANSYATGTGTAWPVKAPVMTLLRLVSQPGTFAAARNYWDDVSTAATTETQGETLVRALTASADKLARAFDSADAASWLWGRKHVLKMPADLFSSFGISTYDNGPYANDGGFATVDVANPDSARTGDFSHTAGPSMRMQCEADPVSSTVSCQYQLPGGQSQHRTSPNYEDHLPLWLSNTPRDLNMSVAPIEAATISLVPVRPAR